MIRHPIVLESTLIEFAALEDVTRLAGARLPTRHGDFQADVFGTREHPDRHHLALVSGDLAAAAPLVRVHTACPGERFGSLVCDCASRLRHAMLEIAAAEAGVLIYLRGPDAGPLACARDVPQDRGVVDAILRAVA